MTANAQLCFLRSTFLQLSSVAEDLNELFQLRLIKLGAELNRKLNLKCKPYLKKEKKKKIVSSEAWDYEAVDNLLNVNPGPLYNMSVVMFPFGFIRER